ncbi:DNA repair exonuclease [Candidatus Woesearchaeota archaeon]|nr:DNA repair exonuclease [Candidatus Woesearchaeota archaeon]
MKFAHISDGHVGGWGDDRMRSLGEESFSNCIIECIKERVDFVLFCGDLFNTSVPPVDSFKLVVECLKNLSDVGIKFYYIAGSHDASSTGRTFLDIIETAGLGKNVMVASINSDGLLNLSPVVDEKTGVSIFGICGRRSGLDKEYYEILDRHSLENVSGRKIFLFHTAISELKPKGLENIGGVPLSFFPKNFDYYAGGHIHSRNIVVFDGFNIVYPGPVFPNSFSELEVLKFGSFVIVEDWVPRIVNIPTCPIQIVHINADGLTSDDVVTRAKSVEVVQNSVILLRIYGRLFSGRASNISIGDIVNYYKNFGAFHVLRNTLGLNGDEFEDVKVPVGSIEDVEERVIRETSIGRIPEEYETSKKLLDFLSVERLDGETVNSFENRIVRDVDALFGE